MAGLAGRGSYGATDTVPEEHDGHCATAQRRGDSARLSHLAVVRPMTEKNIWRLCKVYDLEQTRALLGHARIDATQVYASK